MFYGSASFASPSIACSRHTRAQAEGLSGPVTPSHTTFNALASSLSAPRQARAVQNVPNLFGSTPRTPTKVNVSGLGAVETMRSVFKNNEGELMIVDVEALRDDIRYAVAWVRDEYHDLGRRLDPALVMRLVVNAVRTLNGSYTDGVVLAELEKLTPDVKDAFDQLTGGEFSLTLLKKEG